MNKGTIWFAWLAGLLFSFSTFAITALEFEKRVFFANPASNIVQQTFIRFVNTNSKTVSVEITAIDDDGQTAPGGILSFDLPFRASLQLNGRDLEAGNPGKGTSGSLGNGKGKWQLKVSSTAPIEIMSLIRTPDGFVTSLTDVVPKGVDGTNEVFFANPASNQTQQSFIRVVNRTDVAGVVVVSAVDDSGTAAPGGDVTFSLGPNESKQFNSLDYENGNPVKGLTGALGDGTGKWRLSFSSLLDLEVMSLIRTPDGFLTNLSGVTPNDDQGNKRIFFANPASNTDQQTFIRVINTSSNAGTVTISGVDDDGAIAPNGTVQFEMGPLQSKQLNAGDLETGNAGKGITGGLGSGFGRWQLSINSGLTITVMNMIRTSDGFVTNLSRIASPSRSQMRELFFVNPGSNPNQRSFIRIINTSPLPGSVTISAIDDAGSSALRGTVTFDLAASAIREISAVVLEDGMFVDGILGVFGDGTGKWRLSISTDVSIEVLSLLDTPTGFLTNLSRIVPTVLLVDTTDPEDGASMEAGPDAVTVTFNQAVLASGISASSVTLTGSGGDGTFNDGNEDLIVADAVALNFVDASIAELDLSSVTLAEDTYRLMVIGTGSEPVSNLDGLLLDGEADGITGGDFTSEFTIVTASPTANLSFIQANVFSTTCAVSGCHAGSNPAAGMNLGAGLTFSNTVGVPSLQQPGLMRINPGNPDASYLIRKLEGGPAISLQRMPRNSGPLAQTTIDNIREWITNGAQDN